MDDKLKNQIEQGVHSLLRIDAEKEMQKTLVEDIADVFNMTKKQASELIKAAYDKQKYESNITNWQETLSKIEELGF
jgi:aspartate ammonia-lyase